MTCPECGARNTADAPWCTQCLTPFVAPEPPSAPASTPPSEPAPSPATRAGSTDAARDYRTRDGDVEWRCRECHQWNPMGAPACTVCGGPMPGVDRSGAWSRQRVARTRRVLWLVAGVICLLALVGVVFGVVAVGGAG